MLGGGSFEAAAIIIAAGSEYRKLGVAGENGITAAMSAFKYLQETRKWN